MFKKIKLEKGKKTYLTLLESRLTLELALEIKEASRLINEDDEVMVVLIRGSEDFCTGSDYEPSDNPPPLIASMSVLGIKVPVLCELRGKVYSGGLELALSCDMRFCSEDAEFCFPEVEMGLMPCGGGTQFLPRLIGRGRASEMLLLGGKVSGKEAEKIGLVNNAFPKNSLSMEVEKIVDELLSKAPIALKYAKEAVRKGLELPIHEGMRLEGDLSIILQTTRDRDEGIKAFLEKRKPKFEGK